MDNKVIAVIMGLFVGVLLVGSVLVPIVESSKSTIEPITEYNVGTGQTYREAKAGDVLKFVGTYNDGVRTYEWTLNDKGVMNASYLDWEIGLFSDAFWIQIYPESNSSGAMWKTLADPSTGNYVGANASTPNSEWIITFGESTITWSYVGAGVNTPATAEYDYTWAFVPCVYEDGGYMCSTITDGVLAILNDPKDVVLCGSYTTGEIDTGYTYYKGVAKTYTSGITAEYTPDYELRNGTYDLYDVDIKFTVSDGASTEEFNPYKALVPYKVTGHADNGASINLLGVIPVIVILALLSMAVFGLIRSRY